ncbi:MAG: hypothetical protein ACI832_000165 [Rheinheimera aquimaris]|jgi:hypothetical protein|uniref:DUF1801 domain-containing protein n=1 Tax=Rheinheimera aquimaris TaxID=412437 RepID=UPI000E9604F2|nr:DUF1801 domain-containing protein [Rheinheimera sp.]|tara:strand:- start:2624 stop:3040 length:417 start_codon:yes stop_codon:yes gene_type:complete
MAELKTKATDASIEEYIASRANEEQKADCENLIALLKRVTEERPKMWGPSIIGYGLYKYTYESGRTGEMCRTGFAIRGKELVVYLIVEGAEQEALLKQLGKYKMGKSCLHIKRLADIDVKILEQLIIGSLVHLKARYG